MRNYLLHPRTSEETRGLGNKLEIFTNNHFRDLNAINKSNQNLLEIKNGKETLVQVHFSKNQVIYIHKNNMELARYLSKIYELNFPDVGEWVFNFRAPEG